MYGKMMVQILHSKTTQYTFKITHPFPLPPQTRKHGHGYDVLLFIFNTIQSKWASAFLACLTQWSRMCFGGLTWAFFGSSENQIAIAGIC